MDEKTLTQLLTRTKIGHDCYGDAARLASEGDLVGAAVMARASAEAYADAAELTAALDGADISRSRIYLARAEKSAALAATMLELVTLSGKGPRAEAGASAEHAARAVRRARIALDPRLDYNDLTLQGLDVAAEIADAYAVVDQYADDALTHADSASQLADECEGTQIAQDAQDLAAQSRAAAVKAVRATGMAMELAPAAYSTGATAAPDRAEYAVTVATVADRAATKAELHAARRQASEAVTSLRRHIAASR